jgi:hypothetical protein
VVENLSLMSKNLNANLIGETSPLCVVLAMYIKHKQVMLCMRLITAALGPQILLQPVKILESYHVGDT